MRYHFYTTSEKAWKGMLFAIAGAKKSIYLEMYIFQNDTAGYDFFAALEKKAREGVKAIVVLDAFGSYGLSLHAIDRLRKAGAEVLFFSFWFRRLHRKVLIIDESIAFVGGVNIGKHYARWRDLQVRVGGKIVRTLVRSFARIYRESGGKNPAFRESHYTPILTKARMWFVERGIGERRHALKRQYAEHIDGAQSSLVLVTPYLVPRRWLVARLHQAILRGVRVEIIVPERTDYRFIDRINYYYLHLFAKLGAVCLLSREMNHAKAMLSDERIGTVGSHNLDTLSFHWNEEAGVFFDNPGMVRKLRRILDEWEKGAVRFETKTYRPDWLDTLFSFVLRVF
ncbi:MAG: phosphatidylserine/phosphatidylglycerophosphate/cardiolipin synthase family protein [Parcubacteria group bacterium]|nr:phosphatidylserine/phosphatidylglycerophosphate/cardiolipin synthase family protein [Parcubacteria group bacterium]